MPSTCEAVPKAEPVEPPLPHGLYLGPKLLGIPVSKQDMTSSLPLKAQNPPKRHMIVSMAFSQLANAISYQGSVHGFLAIAPCFALFIVLWRLWTFTILPRLYPEDPKVLPYRFPRMSIPYSLFLRG